MKSIKSFFTMLIILFILPIIAKAFTSLEISTPNPPRGSSFYIQVNADYIPNNGEDLGIKDFHVVISYDPEFFDYEDVTWQQGVYQLRATKGKIYIDKNDDGRVWSAKTSPVMLRFSVKKIGTTNMTIDRTEESHYRNGDIIAQSFSGVTISTVEPSTNTLIGSIGVEGYNMEPTFKKTTTAYYVTVPAHVTSVKIIAQSSDKKQKIDGGGLVTLDYGKNVFDITVTAQDGSKRIYTLTITRKDDRTGDTSLKSISVSDTDIKYQEGVTDYKATVSRSVDSVLISARTNDNRAYLTGTGRKGLNIGENHFQLYVTSSNNNQTVYNITIIRSTEELEKAVQSSKLRNLRVNSIGLDLSEDKKVFLVGVRNDIKDLPIETVTESKTAKVEIIGDKNLKEGLNTVTITVKEVLEEATEEEEEKALVDEYKIIVYRNPDDSEVVTELDKIKTSNNPLFISPETSPHLIPSSAIDYINNNDKVLYYNVVNIYNGLIYQAKIPKLDEARELDASFKETEEDSGDYYTTLPQGTVMTVYVGDKYDDETNVRIYSYSEGKEYQLVTDGLTVINGYIEFTLNGDTNYIVTLSELIEEKGPFEQFFSNYGTIIGASLFIIVIVVMYLVILSKRKAKKLSNEPSY